MSRALKEGLLRTFFSYSAEAGLKLLQGKIEGVIFRHALIRALSDISLAEKSQIPIEPIRDTEALLGVLEDYGIWQNGVKVLPVFNSTYELEHFWGRTEIIKALEAVPRITAWEPPRVEKSQINPANLLSSFSQAKEEPPRKVEIKVEVRRPQRQERPTENEPQKKLEKEAQKISQDPLALPKEDVKFTFTRPKIPEKIPDKLKKEWEAGKLAIWALETLPFPILALNLQGQELFHNAAWEDLEKKHPQKLSLEFVYETAQKAISQRALKSDLQVQDILELPIRLEKFQCMLRAIHIEGRTIGYLIWAIEKKETLISKEIQNDFLGKTLPEILAEAEKKALLWAYEEAEGNKSNAAMLLGIPRQTYGYRLKKYLG